MVSPNKNDKANNTTLGISKGSSRINMIYRYGVDRLYSVMFFNKNTCIKTSITNRKKFTRIVLLIFFLLRLQSRLLWSKFINYYIHILQLTKIYSKFHFHI